MSPGELALILLGGVWAGTINVVVGSGTLVTFPLLLALGVPPITANVSNSIGLVPGSITGAWGYRRELRRQRDRVSRYLISTCLGGIIGAVLLLSLPDGAFAAIVPVLIIASLILVIAQPRLSAWVARRHEQVGGLPDVGAPWVAPAMFGVGIYGGYFGAAQGIMQMAVMGTGIPDDLQRLNALKNVLAAALNGISGAIFIVVADVDWAITAVIAVGTTMGGLLGARVGRRLSPTVLRWVIVAVGSAALIVFLS